jgi:lysophospholipase L1-like esterase
MHNSDPHARRAVQARSFKVALPAVVFLLGFICLGLELGVRMLSATGRISSRDRPEDRLQQEPALFSRSIFPRRAQYVTARLGGFAIKGRFPINEHGYRGGSFEFTKRPGTTRLIAYGGSQVFDMLVSDLEDWPHRAGRRLQERGFSEVEMINAGVPGSTSIESVGRLLAEGHHLDPDYVLLLNTWNDLKYFQNDEPILRQFGPGRLDPRLTYQNPIDRFLCNISQTYLRLRSEYYHWKLNLGPEGAIRWGPPAELVTDSALRQYRLNLRAFVDLTRSLGATPVLMIQPRLPTPDLPVELRYPEELYERLGRTFSGVIEGYRRADEVIRETAREKRVALIDASASLSGRVSMFGDPIHFSSVGSSAMARIVADELVELLSSSHGDGRAGEMPLTGDRE